jgi:acyl carrier protein
VVNSILLQIIGEALEHEGDLNAETKTSDLDGWDSIGILSLIMMLDENGYNIDGEILMELDTIGDLLDLLEAKKND